ncbi:MAG TPA: ATP-binding protein [Dictyobacter sp.]|nr:ATP-binding protein [Dictyobacter sp.]
MESSVHSTPRVLDNAFHSPDGQGVNRLFAIRQEMEYLNTIGKRFVAALDRFQVHRALLAALQELYSFSACCILLKGDPYELFIIPCYPLEASFLESMFQRIGNAASYLNFPAITPEQLARTAYFDAPDELAQSRVKRDNDNVNKEKAANDADDEAQIGSCLNIPLTVENRIIGMLSLFDEHVGTFDTNLLQLTTMIADYAAVALENVRLRERENALWRETEIERMRLELIIGSMAEGLLITDARGAITSLNKSAEQLLAQGLCDCESGVPLHKIAETSSATWLPRLVEIIGQALSGKTVKNQEVVAGNVEERVPLTLNISASPLHDSSRPFSQPIGVVAVLNDVTSNKQIERLKDDFVSVVSHELRTPLTAIKGYTQHLVRRLERRLRKPLRNQSLDSEQVELPEQYDLRNLNIIQSQTAHLERLVNDLLDLSQVQWGQLNLHYETFSLTDVLTENVHLIQASAEQHTMITDIQTQDTNISADRARIGQVIGNILDNAVKYSPHGGQIKVTLHRESNNYLVSVEDHGIGISPEHFEHIFERFYRIHNTASQNYSGIGLGLYVAKAIVNKHGGRIWLANNQNTGSTFYFTLPIVQPH